MAKTSTYPKTICYPYSFFQKMYKQAITKNISFILLFMAALMISSLLKAQDVLVGLTSNGGPEGKGTAFSLKTNGSNFSVIQGFADWGKNPNGDLLLDDDGNFYGMTSTGGTYGFPGTIFKMTPKGEMTILKQLNGDSEGSYPHGELIKGPDGNFYGMTRNDGVNNYGTIFKITPSGAYTVMRSFSYSTDGANPYGHLVLGKDGNFYGITYGGGANGTGTIFKMTPGGNFTVLRSMNKTTDGGNSYGSLTEGTDGNLYGITYYGGTYGYGTIFKIGKSGGNTFKVLRHLNTADGVYSQGDLIQAKDGNFYGMCYGGGANNNGTIFKITTDGKYTVLKSLSSPKDGGFPYGNLMQNSDGSFYGTTRSGGANNAGTIFKLTTSGTFSVIHSFVAATEGSTANGSLVKGKDGNLYGMTHDDGPYGSGTVFKVTTAGELTVLAAFDGSEKGSAPYESLVKGKDSAYYGTTFSGGKYGYGTIFKICGGATTVLHSFNRNTDGGRPKGSLVLASDGNFYGVTPEGGSKGYGTIFRITPAGKFSVIYNIAPGDGSNIQGTLIQAKDGFLWGMSNSGGPKSGGTIFKVSLSGSFSTIYGFDYTKEGSGTEGDLIQASDDNFYGMTANNAHVFKMTPKGELTLLHTFVVSSEGNYPLGSLVEGKDGNLYGTTGNGGANGAGTIFKMTKAGKLTVLKQLNPAIDGRSPKGSLLQAADGNFYGTTSAGGKNNAGTIFKITPGGNFSVLRHLDLVADGGAPFGSLIIAPVNKLIANAQSITVAEDSKKTITLTGSGGSALKYNIAAKPKHGKVSTGTTASHTYTPAANYNGADQFSFTVSSGCITSAPAIVSITVTPVADTPVLAAIGNKTVAKNALLTFTAKATDADAGQTLKFSLVNAPSGAAINATSGVFKWTPATTGNFTFKVRVTDNGTPALFDEEQITVTVKNSVALNALEAKTDLTLNANMYPNPVDNRFYVTIPSAVSQLTLRIVDMNGAVISTANYNSFAKQPVEVDASQLKPGVYLLQLQSEQLSQTLKFIKK
ncbi:MAG: choice-of-anchor tandem repeat GloVer-containing protein [Ilyomonas sp.]